MFGHRWLHLRLSKAPRRVFIDSPDRPVNLGLKHPPRPHVRSGWLDWRLWLYGFICWSNCKPVEWNPCRWMMSGLSGMFVVCQQTERGWTQLQLHSSPPFHTRFFCIYAEHMWHEFHPLLPHGALLMAGVLMHVFTVFSPPPPRRGH